MIKVAGARAAEGASLDDVTVSAEKANDNTRSMGLALSSCVIPASGKHIFEIGPDELELGLGIHGEPGVQRTQMLSANEAAEKLLSPIIGELGITTRSEVAVMVNGLGTTPLSELFIVARTVLRTLQDAGTRIVRSYVGNYTTSLDMAGCSVTLLKLDSELKRLLLAPAESPAFVQV